MKKLVLLFLAVISFNFMPTSALAIVATQNGATALPAPTEKKMGFVEKIKVKFEESKLGKMMKPNPAGILDKSSKFFLKIWLLGWLVGAVLLVLGALVAAPIAYIGYLVMLLGSVAFVIWLLKVLDVM